MQRIRLPITTQWPVEMDIAEWQKRLTDNFTFNGVVGGHLLKILDLERDYEQYHLHSYHGQSVLMESFQSFYVETIRNAFNWVRAHGWPPDAPDYPPILFYNKVTFHRFRACEILQIRGYPLDGYALLRDLKDRALLLCGVAQNLTTFPRIIGYDGASATTEAEWIKLRHARKKAEKKVFEKVLGRKSGLREDIIEELYYWQQLFHEEVHGSRFSWMFEIGDFLRGSATGVIGPRPREDAIALYMNRASEVAWLITRLFPYLQPERDAFGPQWKLRHAILDDSFRYAQLELSKLEKKIGEAFITLVDNKFSFGDQFHYFQADNSD